MEEAYEAALQRVGGQDAAKPKAVHELLALQFPHLTMQNVKWHIQTHRKWEEMRRNKPADYSGPTRWVGRLEEAYEAEVARQGGLYAARPKALLEALLPQFPDLTLQIVKWHLRLRRRKDQQEKSKGGGVGSGALSGSTGGTLVPVQAQRAAARSQQQPAASQQPAANQLPAASSQPPAAARQAPLSHSQQSVPGSGGSTTPLHADPLLHLQLLRQQQQEEQRWLEAQHAAQQAQLLSSLQRRPASREPGLSAALLRGERPPWAPLLPPAAMDAALRCTFTRNCCAKVVDVLQHRVDELRQLVELLKAAGGADSTAGDASAAGSTAGGHPLGALPPEVQQQLLPLLVGVLPRSLLHGGGDGCASRRGWPAAAAGGPGERPPPATRRQRTLASLTAKFPTVRDDVAAASWRLGL